MKKGGDDRHRFDVAHRPLIPPKAKSYSVKEHTANITVWTSQTGITFCRIFPLLRLRTAGSGESPRERLSPVLQGVANSPQRQMNCVPNSSFRWVILSSHKPRIIFKIVSYNKHLDIAVEVQFRISHFFCIILVLELKSIQK